MIRLTSKLLLVLVTVLTMSGLAKASSALVSSDANQVTLRVTLYDVKKKKFLDTAVTEALERVLFRGVADTKWNRPLAGPNESELREKYKDYFKQLFSKRAGDFVNATIPQISGEKDATGRKAYVADVTINMDGLKRDLEANKIIRKFGL